LKAGFIKEVKVPRHSKGNFQAVESRLYQRSDPYKVGGKSCVSS
jgi:hypothetical protein